MVGTAVNFAAGFFGVPEYRDQAPGVDDSGAPYEVCDNANVAGRGDLGTAAGLEFGGDVFHETVDRLNSQVQGITFDAVDVVSMLQLCSYETVALGYSTFCELFGEEDFRNYEYIFDLNSYYTNGPGSPVSAAQGKGYRQEFMARFTGEYPPALNATFDNSDSIHADATHEVVVMDTLMAFNLTALFAGPPLRVGDWSARDRGRFAASKGVPFATHFTVQVLSCPAYRPTKQIRFILNDAVVPVADSYPGCPEDPHGLCAFEHVVEVLKDRIGEVDFDYDCFANYTAEAGHGYKGRAPMVLMCLDSRPCGGQGVERHSGPIDISSVWIPVDLILRVSQYTRFEPTFA
ncbi:histidine phosphatase superfamily [Xylariomycetidae sp. FL0641]|nr:histidine phosphatase superfamily [Xylariomycetidae sp. FL0641]